MRSAQTQARRSVNTQLISLYWSIDHELFTRQDQNGWGSGVIGRLAADLRTEFPNMKGLSRSNLQYMRSFADAWTVFDTHVPQPVGHLPWGHIRTILDKKLDHEARNWYAAAAVEHGWSGNVFMNMIMNKTLERSGAAPSNFAYRLVAPVSALAQQIAKDPYSFAFLGLSGEVAERDLEQRLLDRMVETLRELGPGFAF